MGLSLADRYITDYLLDNARRFPDKLAIDFEGQQGSWSRLLNEVRALRGYFSQQLGTEKQKVVALLLTNSLEFVKTYLAILDSGHMVMPLDPAYKKLELDSIIQQVKPAMLITSARYRQQISQPPQVIMVDKIPIIESSAKPLRIGSERQVASLTFTSGTSGRPKVVPNTHANHIWNIRACSEVWRWSETDRLLICLPLSHMHGLVIGLSGAIYHGNSLYLKQQAFRPQEVLDELASGRISMFTHVPLGYAKLLEVDRTVDLSSVRVLISGAAPLPPAIWQEFKKRFNVEIVETYGTSETGRIAGNRLDKKVLGSPGPPLPGVEVKLSKDAELLVKSPGVFPGYYKNPVATKNSWAAGGYWRTGDMVELRDGNIFLKGRLQERIRRFGYTVSPRDVEWALLKNPEIKDIYVMGRQTPDRPNDELTYFIVTGLSDQAIAEYCKANLLFAWRPDRVIRLEELPRTSTGKTSLPKLRKLMESAA